MVLAQCSIPSLGPISIASLHARVKRDGVVSRLSGPARWVAVASIVGFVASGTLAFCAFRIEAYAGSPAPEELWRFGDWTTEQIQFRFLTTRFQALERNRRNFGESPG